MSIVALNPKVRYTDDVLSINNATHILTITRYIPVKLK